MNKLKEFQSGMSFDSSLSEAIDKTLTSEEYVQQLISLIIPILQKRFNTEPSKQQYKVHKDRINFACPYCGDSMQYVHKKRGNIILEGKHKNFYKCFNCGIFKRVDTFLKNFDTALELDVVNYISQNLGNFETTSSASYDISLLLDIEKIEKYAIDREELKKKFNLVEVKQSSIWNWLVKRMQYDESKFLYNQSENYVLILNLTSSGKIIGAQKRLFKSYPNPKYTTFTISKMRSLLEKEECPDEIDIISQLFGILYLNFNLPVTIFEGPFDSFLFKNSIANAGANKNFPLDIPVRYWYDDDKTGREQSIKAIDAGFSVFLWSKLKKDLEIPYRKKMDLNDLIIWAKINNVKLPLLDNYFSTNGLDIIDI